jgi:hypothetical protein
MIIWLLNRDELYLANNFERLRIAANRMMAHDISSTGLRHSNSWWPRSSSRIAPPSVSARPRGQMPIATRRTVNLSSLARNAGRGADDLPTDGLPGEEDAYGE